MTALCISMVKSFLLDQRLLVYLPESEYTVKSGVLLGKANTNDEMNHEMTCMQPMQCTYVQEGCALGSVCALAAAVSP